MIKGKQSGFSIAIVVAVVAFLVVGGLIVWQVYQSSQQASNQTATSQPAAPQDDQHYVTIGEWGVRLTPADGLVGLQAISRPSSLAGTEEIMLITDEMKKLNPACSGEAEGSRPLGALVRAQSKLAEPGNKQFLKEVNGYFYYYYSPASSCSPDANNEAIQSATLTKVKDSLASLEAASN